MKALWIDGLVFGLFFVLIWLADAYVWPGVIYFVLMLR